ncbi:hypothetical protein [Aliterella atlantica]|uniref:Uncharacterized protein n=1 Tax=Aliterella atlantica CENA595 TaxID=1618023 RepID=A0A0D8ZWP7_9CYAN|nr:hypothetical protein [Aliterella atlantica]KJH73178.1 hypothetical protein UH38_03770 [Aliterella atlantica CENA595]
MPRYRIVVIGESVLEVQRVSRCCLAQGIEVFPYYGVPSPEEISLFSPHLTILCSLPNSNYPQIDSACVVWSEQPINSHLHVISNMTELYNMLQSLQN